MKKPKDDDDGYPKNNPASEAVKKMFDGMGTNVEDFQKMIIQQGKINGLLRAACEDIVQALRKVGKIAPPKDEAEYLHMHDSNSSKKALLDGAMEYLALVGGKEPPGCQIPGSHGG
jgi:hypothetical protein